MYRRAAIVALFLPAVLPAGQQPSPPAAALGPIILKSTTRAVQLDVFVNDPSGRPVHGLQKNDFVVTDNGHPRDIRIFAGEIDASQKAPSSATTAPPGVYSNRFGVRGSRFVTAIVIDAVPRPAGLQKDGGIFALKRPPELWINLVRSQAISAINRMEPGQTIAIYAACPDLRILQDYTSDPDRLAASVMAFVPPRQPDAAGKKQSWTIDAYVPPMLSALSEVASRMAGASGSKSVVWISQAYGLELNLSAISGATNSTVAALNDANVPLYAVDARFSPTCQLPEYFPSDTPVAEAMTCSQRRDISDEWMEYLAQATGGRAFSGGKVTGIQVRDDQARSPETQTEMVRYARAVKLINGAVLLHIRIRDQATNRVGSIAIPIGKQ